MLDLFSNFDLPFYITITLFLAYIIWSKFLKKDELIPKNINDILDIFSICIYLLTFFIATSLFVTVLFMIIFDLFDFGFVLQKMSNTIPNIIVFLAVYTIWSVTSVYRNRKVLKNDFKSLFIKPMIFLLLYFISFGFGIIYLIIFTPLKYFFWAMIIPLSIIILLIMFCYITVNNVLFEINLRKDILNKRFLITALISTIFVVVLFSQSTPEFNYNELIYEDYQMYGLDSDFGEAYLHAKILIDVETFGLIGSYVPLIEIPYEQYGFETEGNSGKNFRILINSTKENRVPVLIESFDEIKNFQKKTENKFSFTDIILYEEKGTLLLKYNPKTIKDEDIKTIILEGYIKQNMSNLDYSYDSTDYCNAEGCNLTFNIKNNLDLPVYHNEHTIVNLNNRDITNTSKCRLTHIASDYPTDDNISERGNHCSGTFCELDIIDVPFDKTIFALKVFLHEDVVRLKFIDIKKPIDINVQANLVC